MRSTGARKPHAVCVPFPAQGHVTPLMRLAKLLHSRGFHITFVNTEFNHRRLIRSRGPDSVEGLPDFRFETIPDGLPLPPSDFDATQDVPSLCDSTRKNCLTSFKELLTKLNSSSEGPPVTCVISDGAMSFGIEAAEEFSIPQVQFWTASACSFMGYLHFSELTRRGLIRSIQRALKEHQSVSKCPFRKKHFKTGARKTVTVSSKKMLKLHAIDDTMPVTPGIQVVEVTAPATAENYSEVVAAVSSFCEYLAPLLHLSKPGVSAGVVPTAAAAAASLMSDGGGTTL